MHALQHYLQTAPISILVIMGPRSSGKTALLQEILHNSNLDIPPSYLNGRSGQLSEESVLVRLLQEKGATALQKLSVVLKDFANTSIGRASTAVSIQPKGDTDSVSSRRDKVVAAFLHGDSQRMSDVIEVYNDMLELTKTRKLPPSGNWPIICIDEANVLMQWQQGSLEKKQALTALLNLFVKVRNCPFLHILLYFQSPWRSFLETPACGDESAHKFAGIKGGQLGSCHFCDL